MSDAPGLDRVQPDEFVASGGSPPERPQLSDALAHELAQILADALHEDLMQYPELSQIPVLVDATVASPSGYDRSRNPLQCGARSCRRNSARRTATGKTR